MGGKLGMKRFNIVNNVESTLAREAKCGVFLNAGKETSIASTKAFLNQVIAFSLITIWFASRHNYKHSKPKRIQLWTELSQLSAKVKHVVESIPEFSKACALKLKDQPSIFLLGLGLGECVAKEGSLKLKELTYKHC
jgi:glucosamine--fructose-6-phosphate aminotransferase (isomerizing)